MGTALARDGTVYAGPFRNGLREGADGLITYSDGSTLRGAFAGDLPSGAMVWRGAATNWLRTYDGAWADGRPSGKGTATFADGSTFVGLWKVRGYLFSLATR